MKKTEAHVHEALRLSPHDIFAFRWLHIVGVAKLLIGAEAEAVAWFRRSIEANRSFHIAHFFLGAALARLGHLDQARAAVRAGLAIDPRFTLRRFRTNVPPSDDPAYLAGRERMHEGLRIAGVPEG